jgi:opacity protein-like surface antigen
MPNRSPVLFALFLLLPITQVAAQVGEDEQSVAEEGIAQQKLQSYMTGSLGYFGGQVDPEKLSGGNGGFAMGLGVGGRFSRNLAFEFDMLYAFREYDTPEGLLFSSDEMTLTNALMFVNARAILPFWQLEPYVGVGFGLVISELDVPSTLVPLSSTATEDDLGLGAQLLIGVDYAFSRRTRMGLEYRRLEADASFGGLSNGKIDIGGKMFLFTMKIPI